MTHRFEFLEFLHPALLLLPVFLVECPPPLHGLQRHVDLDVSVTLPNAVVPVIRSRLLATAFLSTPVTPSKYRNF